MSRTVMVTIAIATIVVSMLAISSRRSENARDEAQRPSDSVWYHASDVALLARTGRPQLVEFFHPG